MPVFVSFYALIGRGCFPFQDIIVTIVCFPAARLLVGPTWLPLHHLTGERR